jgi:hypothetical protein
VVTCLDAAFNLKEVSSVCIDKVSRDGNWKAKWTEKTQLMLAGTRNLKKYSPEHYSKASIIVMQFYNKGLRYLPTVLALESTDIIFKVVVLTPVEGEGNLTNKRPTSFRITDSGDFQDDLMSKTLDTLVKAFSLVDPFVVRTLSICMPSRPKPYNGIAVDGKENLMPSLVEAPGLPRARTRRLRGLERLD